MAVVAIKMIQGLLVQEQKEMTINQYADKTTHRY